MHRTPLTSRPLDLIYFSFFVTHIVASVFVDFQTLYPQHLVPAFLRKFVAWYITQSNDPFLKAAHGQGEPMVWFNSFLFIEAAFQFPTFFVAARALWNDSKRSYILLLVYAASTATTVWPCLATIIATPAPSTDALARGVATLAPQERAMLLSSYVPFFLIPLIMTLDMSFRIYGLVNDALEVREIEKIK
ncbi:putative membrane protein [Mycena kentingensis (nom. inval.)]|nr:putative membrane protein [Mycena kentingensis (nom. inval.)]